MNQKIRVHEMSKNITLKTRLRENIFFKMIKYGIYKEQLFQISNWIFKWRRFSGRENNNEHKLRDMFPDLT